MKNLFHSLMLVAAAATALTACNKEAEIQETAPVRKTNVQFYATVDDTQTKATLTPDEAEKVFTAAWEVDDYMKIIAARGNDYLEEGSAIWNGTYFDTELPEDETVGTWEYFAYYPSDENIDFGSNRIQSGDVYNSAYDVMAGSVTYENTTLGKDEKGGNLVVPMDRLTTILYFHLTSDLDEPVTSATLTVEGGNIAAETAQIAADGVLEAVEGASNTITLTFAEGTAPSAKEFRLWFNALPVTATSLTLTVSTASHTATLTNTTGKAYEAGKLNKIVKNGLTWNEAPKNYVKVTDSDNLVSGQYLIVYEDGSLAFNGGLETLDAVSNTIEVTITDDKIASSETTDAARFEILIGEEGTTIQSASGYYIGNTSDANALKSSEDEAYVNSITFDEDGNANVVSAGSYLRYNSASNQLRFRYYKSSSYTNQKPVALYFLEGSEIASKPSAELAYATTEFDVTLGEAFEAPTLSNPYGVDVTYSSSNEDVATVDASTGAVEILAAGSATITATFAGNDEYKAGKASYTIVVTSTAKTLSQINAAEEGVTVKDVTAVAVSGDNVVLKDATGLGLLYVKDHGITVGDLFDLTGDVTLYDNNNILEFTTATITNKREGSVDHGTADDFDDVAGLLEEDPIVWFVTAKGVQNGRNITTANGNTIYLSSANNGTDGYSVVLYGYTIGYRSSSSSHTVIATSLEVDPDIAELSVDAEALAWLYNETEAKTIQVTINANGSFTHSETNMDWATVEVEENMITVIPNGENTNATANTGTITLTHSTDATKTVEITCEQGGYVNLVTATATFTGAYSGGMNSTRGAQSATRRNVTAALTDGLADASADHIRIYKDATLTLSVPIGAKITKVEFTTVANYSISNLSNNTNGVWTGSEESVSFNASAQVRVSRIEVTYIIEASQLAKYTPTLNVSDQTVYVGDEGSIGATSDTDGAITYELVSGSNYITLDAETGNFTAEAEGTAVVKVSSAASESYDAGSKNVNITVNKKPEGGSTETITFSELGYENAADVTEVESGDIKLAFAKGSNTNNAPKYYTTGTGVRMYNGNTLTITGGTITKIVITAAGTSYLTKASSDSGSISTSGSVETWTGSASSVVLTASQTSRTQKIEVTFSK